MKRKCNEPKLCKTRGFGPSTPQKYRYMFDFDAFVLLF